MDPEAGWGGVCQETKGPGRDNDKDKRDEFEPAVSRAMQRS